MAESPPSFDERAHDLAQQGKLREALDCYDEALKSNPDNDVILNNKAIALISLDKCTESLICIRRVISINPQAVEAWINMGVALDNLGHHHEASEALTMRTHVHCLGSYTRRWTWVIRQRCRPGNCRRLSFPMNMPDSVSRLPHSS